MRIGAWLPQVNNNKIEITLEAQETKGKTAVMVELRCGRVWLKRK